MLLQQRSWWGSYGGAWGPPGGARDSHESVVRAALREAIEECAIDPRPVRVHGVLTDDHGGWTYQTVLANVSAPLAAAAVSEETSEVAWVPEADVERLPLHPGFAGQWPALRAALSPLTLIVDAANVMGSRPDGWWRDRAGAARRLCDQIEELALRGVTRLPESVAVPAIDRWFPQFVVVLEGAAAAMVDSGTATVSRRSCGHGARVTTRSSGRPPGSPGPGWLSPPTGSCGPGARPLGRSWSVPAGYSTCSEADERPTAARSDGRVRPEYLRLGC